MSPAERPAHSPSPVARLTRRPAPFDFFQAVALLEAAARRAGELPADWKGVGKELDPEHELIRFRSSLSLGFAESDVTRVERRNAEARKDRRQDPRHLRTGAPHAYSMEVSFFGLTGAHGALPLPFAELVARRGHLERAPDDDGGRREAAMRELLDIFSHRLLAHYYRAGKRARPALGASDPKKTALLHQVAATIGLGTPALLDSARNTHSALLHTAGIAAREARSTAAISVALASALGLPPSMPVVTRPFAGGWTLIEPRDRTLIGRAGQHHRLGQSATLGGRVYDPSSGILVEVGSPKAPLWPADFRSLMPGGERFSTLCRVARFLAGPSLELSIRCTYVTAGAPAARLGQPGAVQPELLGLTAVLGRRRPPCPAASGPPTRTVTIPAAAVRRAEASARRKSASAAPRSPGGP